MLHTEGKVKSVTSFGRDILFGSVFSSHCAAIYWLKFNKYSFKGLFPLFLTEKKRGYLSIAEIPCKPFKYVCSL